MQDKPVVFGWNADYAGSGLYRIILPLTELARRGWKTRASSQYRDAERITGRYSDVRVLVGQRISQPGPSQIWRENRAGHKRVFEVDDDLFSVPAANPGHSFFSQREVRTSMVENIQAADLVTVSTPVLAERLARLNPNIRVIPNYIPDALLDVDITGDRPLTIGWFGSYTHAGDFAAVRDHLARVLRRHPHVRMALAGAHHPERLPRDQVVLLPWQTDLWALYRQLRFDIGIAPLAIDHFNRAKSALKVLEYGALGIPVVATALDAYEGFVQHGVTGFLVKREHEWVRYLTELINDEELRVKMGNAGREQAREWTLSAHGHEWEQALRL